MTDRADNPTPDAVDGLMCLLAIVIALAVTCIAVTWGLPR